PSSVWQQSATCLLFCAVSRTTLPFALFLHDALPIYQPTDTVFLEKGNQFPELAHGKPSHLIKRESNRKKPLPGWRWSGGKDRGPDRKSTRLNSSHGSSSYAVFCLKKKARRTPQEIIQ